MIWISNSSGTETYPGCQRGGWGITSALRHLPPSVSFLNEPSVFSQRWGLGWCDLGGPEGLVRTVNGGVYRKRSRLGLLMLST